MKNTLEISIFSCMKQYFKGIRPIIFCSGISVLCIFGNAGVGGTLVCHVASISRHMTAVWLTGGRSDRILLFPSYATGNIPAWLAVSRHAYCDAEPADNNEINSRGAVGMDALASVFLLFCFEVKYWQRGYKDIFSYWIMNERKKGKLKPICPDLQFYRLSYCLI
jgi:hypothetical protein